MKPLTPTAANHAAAIDTAEVAQAPRSTLVGRLRLLLVGIAGLAVLLTGCASAEAPDGAVDEAAGSVRATSPPTAEEHPPAHPAEVEIDAPDEPADDPTADHPDVAVIARAMGDLEIHGSPGQADPFRTLAAQTDFGSTTVALVLTVGEGDADGWLEVLLPGRPNGATGWVRADAVELREIDVEVAVDLAARELTVLQDGEAIVTTEVAIGDGEHPTPTGRFFVTDKLDTGDPGGAYGPYAIGLSGRSEVLTEFAGGDGQIGIHGTNDPTSIGEAASHGCVRVPNTIVRDLVTLLPLGTPVVIS